MKRWTDAEVKKLIDLWNREVMIKLIVLEVGHAYSSIKAKARQLKLVSRHETAPRGGRTKIGFQVYLTDGQFKFLCSRASSFGLSRSAYLRRLIAKDHETT